MKLTLPAAAALLLTSTAAMAEIAPQDIIDSWGDYYGRFNGTVTTDAPEKSGTSTRFSNFVAQTRIMGSTSTYMIEYVDIESNADGSVNITFSPDASANILMDANGITAEGTASYDIGSLILHVEGSPEDMRYSFNAPIVTMQLDQTQSEPALDLSVSLALQGLHGTVASTTETQGAMAQSSEMSVGTLSASVTVEPQNNQRTYVTYRGENVSIAYDMSVSQWPETTDMLSMFFPEDMVFGMTIATGNATTVVDQSTEGGKGRFTFTQSGGELTAAYAENALSYGLTATGAALSLANTPTQPVDFTAAFERFHFGATYPMRKSDTPVPFAFALALESFTLDDRIWDKLDPEATLSRAPASFAFSLNGTIKMFIDLFDQAAITNMRGTFFELRSLSLSALSIDFEGMGLTGEGGVTFNNERIDPMSGLPEPTGTLDFSINGALGLLDKIGLIGIGDPMFIIGAKGALGMFATPNDGPDSFTSRIEFTEGGHISVNGQQVK